ncbi:MAG: site-specific integrase [Methylobacterium mesophilicum]|nr:site-specific integrase [Methylobacterium mesophilicum]
MIRHQIADETRERVERALGKAGYDDEHKVPEGVEVPGIADALKFQKLSNGTLTPTTEHISEWLSTLTNEKKTKDMKEATVKKFAENFAYLQDVDRKAVQRWFNERASEENLTAKTLKRVLSELRSYWSYLRSLELVDEEVSPFERLTMHGRKSASYSAFSPEQVVTLLRAAEAAEDVALAEVITLAM